MDYKRANEKDFKRFEIRNMTNNLYNPWKRDTPGKARYRDKGDKKMKETKQLKVWKSKFGKDYTDRNVVDPNTRIDAFRKMVGDLDIKTILEVGCNVGHNLVALSQINKNYKLIGVEPLEYAIKKAKELSNSITVLEGNCFEIPFSDSYFDLVFTCNVLIHIAAKDLPKAIDEIYRVSKKYILAIEYYTEKDTDIYYRGHKDLLWKRDFKRYFLEQKPSLKCINEGFSSKEDGFDNCNWWLFVKE